jgi:two-component sensor histidine kinase
VRKAVAAGSEVCGEETAEVVALLFTELVTNAIVHGGTGDDARIDVDLTISPEGVRGAVTDEGAGFEPEAGLAPRDEGGFGLFIVQRLVRHWGVDRPGGRTRVWFDL